MCAPVSSNHLALRAHEHACSSWLQEAGEPAPVSRDFYLSVQDIANIRRRVHAPQLTEDALAVEQWVKTNGDKVAMYQRQVCCLSLRVLMSSTNRRSMGMLPPPRCLLGLFKFRF